MALEQLYDRVRQHAADAVRARRGLACKTAGAQATAMLIKADAIERCNIVKKTHNQVPLAASAVDEPTGSRRCRFEKETSTLEKNTSLSSINDLK